MYIYIYVMKNKSGFWIEESDRGSGENERGTVSLKRKESRRGKREKGVR